MRKQIASMSQYSKLFSSYHATLVDLRDTQQLISESQDDPEMLALLEDDMVRILGDDENYGEIEEIENEIVEYILPMTKAD